MGDNRRRRSEFFARHPFCCFCGGRRLATTIDHQPGRVFFNKRRWPEGFAFPACEQCNNVSRDAERVMAILIHGECDNEDRGKFQKNLASVRRDFPGLVDSMIPKSTNEVRRILRKKNISREPWETFSEVPLVKLKLDHWQSHIDIFSRKILLALHYQCFGRPLHSTGLLWFLSFTNFDFASGEFPQKLIEIAEKLSIPLRKNQNL